VKTRLLKDVHLMIQDPQVKVGDYVDAGADIITVHVESCDDVLPVLRHLATMENKNDPGRGLVRGIACNPTTPVRLLQPLLDDVEMIVVLAVDVMVKGFPFFPSIRQKSAEVREMISRAGKNILLCIDGGVKKNNIAEFAAMGADIVVSGSAILDGKDPVGNAQFMLNAIKSRNG